MYISGCCVCVCAYVFEPFVGCPWKLNKMVSSSNSTVFSSTLRACNRGLSFSPACKPGRKARLRVRFDASLAAAADREELERPNRLGKSVFSPRTSSSMFLRVCNHLSNRFQSCVKIFYLRLISRWRWPRTNRPAETIYCATTIGMATATGESPALFEEPSWADSGKLC